MPQNPDEELQKTQDAQTAEVEFANNPVVSQKPVTDEIPGHLAAKMHAPYPIKPDVQVANESLQDVSPTGYAPHDPAIDLDKAQLESMEPSDTDAYREAKQRVENDTAYRKSSGIDGDAGDWTQADEDKDGYPAKKKAKK